MKLMSMKQYMKMSKKALKAKLKREFAKRINSMSHSGLAKLCYTMQKSKLPRLRYAKKGEFGGTIGVDYKLRPIKRKTKRKFSRKQLEAQRLFAKRAKAGTLRKRRR
tara:strand:- start:847 stop:1167 length:321 start_codon:yes stop_codon:yes gene_type:complete